MNLFLIKHGSPVKDPKKPPKLWKLSEKGKIHAKIIAQKLAEENITAL